MHEGGVLEFGTEVVCGGDGSIAALLGASPGASTAVSIMLGLIKDCFKGQIAGADWQDKLTTMIPSYGLSLAGDEALFTKIHAETAEVLGVKA